MGNPKQKWTSEEEEALRAGVAKHGAGKWKNILRDPEFQDVLSARSNIDLKDKWRNLSVANGAAPRDKSKAPKPKANAAEVPAASLPVVQTPAPVSQSSHSSRDAADTVIIDPEANSAAKYNAMIYEALSTLKLPNGADTSAIANFIEQRQDVPQNFRRVLTSRLRRLVQQNKLEKLENSYYRIKKDPLPISRNPTMRQTDSHLKPDESIVHVVDTVEEAAQSVARIVAEAEYKSFIAAQAVKEAERVSRMAEDMEAFLQFATHCFDLSGRGGALLVV